MSLVTESWLAKNTVKRCVLARVQVHNVSTSLDQYIYLSTTPYITSTSDVQFIPAISGGLQFNESISQTGNVSISYGDLEINNLDGRYDDWLDDEQYIWVNRSIQLYYGDPNWATTNWTEVTTDFELIFDGIVVDIASRNRNKVNIKVRDKMERLNAPVTEEQLGVYGTWAGGQPNVNTIKPLIFGEIHNITPLSIDPSTLEYMANFGPTELLVEVRDNGIPVYTSGSATYTAANVTNIATLGTFKVTASPAGTITITVQGVKNSINLATGALISGTYNNSVANLIALITTQYGKSYTRLNGGTDLDLSNLSSFPIINAGIAVTDSSTVKAICGALAESVGAQLFFTRKGKLQLIRFGVPTGDPTIDISDRDIIVNTLTIAEKIPVIAATRLGYCKNYSVQKDLTTGIPQSHKDLFAEEWLSVTSTIDTTSIKDLYKLTEEPVQKDTYLINTTDAQTEANRLTSYFSVPRTIFTFVGTSRMQLLKLGQQITITHNRFNLNNKIGQVVSIAPNWTTGYVNVGVLI